MSSASFCHRSTHEEMDRDSDLSSLAYDAAHELDEVILGRPPTVLDATRRLADVIERSIPNAERRVFADPSATFALNYALADAAYSRERPGTVDELRTQARAVGEALVGVAARDKGAGNLRLDELRKLRDLCLALSRRAASYEIQSHDDEIHPFRN